MEEACYVRVLAIDKPKLVMINRIVDGCCLFKVLETTGKFPRSNATDAQRMVPFHQEAGVAGGLRQSQALLCHLESSRVFRVRRIVNPESPERVEQLRCLGYPLAQFSRPREHAANFARRESFGSYQAAAESGIQG